MPLAMLALGEIFRLLFINMVSITNDAKGILIMPAITSRYSYYYVGLAMLLLTVLITYLIVHSKIWLLPGFHPGGPGCGNLPGDKQSLPTTLYKLLCPASQRLFHRPGGGFLHQLRSLLSTSHCFQPVQHFPSVMVILVVMLGGVATTWDRTKWEL